MNDKFLVSKALRDLDEVDKALKGEKGDKRNTKYAAVGLAGGTAASFGLAAVPSYRRIERVAGKRVGRALNAVNPATITGPGQVFRTMSSARFGTPGMKRMTAVRGGAIAAGAAAGVGALSAHRKKKAKAEVDKAFRLPKIAMPGAKKKAAQQAQAQTWSQAQREMRNNKDSVGSFMAASAKRRAGVEAAGREGDRLAGEARRMKNSGWTGRTGTNATFNSNRMTDQFGNAGWR